MEIERCDAEIIKPVEQKVVTERKVAKGAATPQDGGESSFPVENDNVLEVVAARGVQVARIVMRVAERLRNVPKKIMPDDENSSRFVLAQRDPETGEMVPIL